MMHMTRLKKTALLAAAAVALLAVWFRFPRRYSL